MGKRERSHATELGWRGFLPPHWGKVNGKRWEGRGDQSLERGAAKRRERQRVGGGNEREMGREVEREKERKDGKWAGPF